MASITGGARGPLRWAEEGVRGSPRGVLAADGDDGALRGVPPERVRDATRHHPSALINTQKLTKPRDLSTQQWTHATGPIRVCREPYTYDRDSTHTWWMAASCRNTETEVGQREACQPDEDEKVGKGDF